MRSHEIALATSPQGPTGTPPEIPKQNGDKVGLTFHHKAVSPTSVHERDGKGIPPAEESLTSCLFNLPSLDRAALEVSFELLEPSSEQSA